MVSSGDRWAILARKSLWAGVFLAATAGSYVLVAAVQHRFDPQTTADPGVAAEDDARPRANPFAPEHGTHLIAFVVTASDCGWCGRPELKAAIGSLRENLNAVHKRRYAAVSVVGISADEDIATGLAYLAEVGAGTLNAAFDQVMVGGGWLNEQIVRLIWQDRLAGSSTL
jgi:hypothetical protein